MMMMLLVVRFWQFELLYDHWQETEVRFLLIESVEIECDFVKTYVAIGREGSGLGFESP